MSFVLSACVNPVLVRVIVFPLGDTDKRPVGHPVDGSVAVNVPMSGMSPVVFVPLKATVTVLASGGGGSVVNSTVSVERTRLNFSKLTITSISSDMDSNVSTLPSDDT